MSVASKNLFELLGNDDEGSDVPKAPVKTVTKDSISTAKAAADGSKPAASAQQNRGGFSRPQQDFRNDKGVGRSANQGRSTEERTAEKPRGGRGARGRGGAGATRHRAADDRHAKNIAPGSEKQAAQAWGATDGDAELKDEQAGEVIAQTEKADADAEDAEGEAKEPEVKQVTLDAYLAERAAAVALNESLKIRKVDDEPEGTALQKAGEEDYFAASAGKAKKLKNKKVKETITWEDNARPSEDRPARGGRGGGRGGDRGDRGDRRGAPRGGAPRGDRGAPRGDRGDRGAPRGGPRGGAPRGAPRGGAPAPAFGANDFPALG